MGWGGMIAPGREAGGYSPMFGTIRTPRGTVHAGSSTASMRDDDPRVPAILLLRAIQQQRIAESKIGAR